MLLTNLALPFVAGRIGSTTEFAALGFGKIQTAYRVIAGALGLLWIYCFVADDFRGLTTALAGTAFLIAHCWRPAKEWHSLSGAYLIVSSIYLAVEFVSGQANWQSLAAIAALLGVQQLARRHATSFGVSNDAHHAMIIGGCIAAFFWATNWVSLQMPNGDIEGLHSITWAALAVIFFSFGLKLKERWYRLMGLAALGVALLSLFPIIWQMSTELKIAAFFVLGLVFVGLGFVYNRNKEQIKKLL